MTLAMVEQSFNIGASIERVRQFEQRGTEFKVRCGLELLRVKMNIDHGAWYAFLVKAGIYPSTATRRMKTALLFLEWRRIEETMAIASAVGIPMAISSPGCRANMMDVLRGINIIDEKPCMLHDFNVAQRFDIDKFWDEIPHQANKYSPPRESTRERIIIVQLNPAWKKIEEFIVHKYKRLRKEKKFEFREWLQMLANRANALVQLVQDVDRGLSAKKSHPKMITGQDVLIDDADKPNYLSTPKSLEN